MAVINSTNIGSKHRHMLVEVVAMLLHKVVIHIPKPLRTGNVAMEVIITSVGKWSK